ncbi:MAG: hypothetical protein V7676_10775 [Parasphingorhabdus sp.]|uniref:hypothetical protein n=1 Tax=Parasphingorhabdus sp. TaxID=2709688 RepID=UPI003001D8DD
MSGKSTSGRDTLPIPYLALALGLVVFILAAVGGWSYTGLINRLGEWQFATFGLYFNLASILIFVALLALVWRIGRTLVRRDRSDDEIEDRAAEDLRNNLLLTTLAKKITGWLGLAIIFSAFVTMIYLVLLPSEDQKTRELSAAEAERGPEGPVELRGVTAIGQTARYRQGFLFWQRTYYFMPIAKEKNQNKAAKVTVFLEVPAKLARSNTAISAKGILRHGTLPDEVASMYAGANIPVAERASVIFANESSSNWATRVLLYDMLLLGFLSLLFSWLLKRRQKRLEKEIGNH